MNVILTPLVRAFTTCIVVARCTSSVKRRVIYECIRSKCSRQFFVHSQSKRTREIKTCGIDVERTSLDFVDIKNIVQHCKTVSHHLSGLVHHIVDRANKTLRGHRRIQSKCRSHLAHGNDTRQGVPNLVVHLCANQRLSFVKARLLHFLEAPCDIRSKLGRANYTLRAVNALTCVLPRSIALT